MSLYGGLIRNRDNSEGFYKLSRTVNFFMVLSKKTKIYLINLKLEMFVPVSVTPRMKIGKYRAQTESSRGRAMLGFVYMQPRVCMRGLSRAQGFNSCLSLYRKFLSCIKIESRFLTSKFPGKNFEQYKNK